MRIGIVCPYSFDVPGGVQFHVRDLAEHLCRLGHQVSVLAPADEPSAMREDWVSWFGIPTQFSPHWDGPPIDEPTYHTRLVGE